MKNINEKSGRNDGNVGNGGNDANDANGANDGNVGNDGNDKNVGNNENSKVLDIDFSKLMDLRIDYAFKLIFGSDDTLSLISLLNAIFKNKNIQRTIKSLIIENPYLEKQSKDDKISILDIRAKLDDDSTILIEMHLYGIEELKYKTIRSWARAYGEEIKRGQSYSMQPPVVCVTFAEGSFDDDKNIKSQKIHKCCKIMDIDDNTVFTDALELHYINMKAFVKAINETKAKSESETKGKTKGKTKGDKESIEKRETLDSMLAKWLAVITEKDIKDKTVIKNICKEQEEIRMAVSKLARLSENKLTRQEYLRRQDDILLTAKRMNDLKEEKRKAEQEKRRADQAIRKADQEKRKAEQEKRRADQEKRRAEIAESALEEKDALIAMLKARLGEK